MRTESDLVGRKKVYLVYTPSDLTMHACISYTVCTIIVH